MMIAIIKISKRKSINPFPIWAKLQLRKPTLKRAQELYHGNLKGSRVGAAKRLAVTNTNAIFAARITLRDSVQINLKFMTD